MESAKSFFTLTARGENKAVCGREKHERKIVHSSFFYVLLYDENYDDAPAADFPGENVKCYSMCGRLS